ncbi:MAG: hypothetical protein ACYDBY_00255 [Thermoanaerobaculia bacterium]
MKRAAVAAAATLLVLGACRSAGPAGVPAGPEEVAQALSSVLAVREEAWRPRRFQALFRGEVSPKVGMAVRGYLALQWDGDALAWSVSAPLVGVVREGRLRRAGGGAEGLLPGRLASHDVLAALFGVPEEAPSAEGASLLRNGRLVLPLPSGEGRAVLVSPAGKITGLLLPDGVRVELTPGAGLPRHIAIRGPDGNAVLTLESFGALPEVGGSNG